MILTRLTRLGAPGYAIPLGGLAAVVFGWQAVARPALPVVALAAVALVIAFMSDLLLGLAIFVVLTFPQVLPSGLGAGTVAKPLGAVLAGSWILLVLRRQSTPFLPRHQPLLTILAVGLVVWGLASALWAVDSGASVSAAARLAQGAVLLFVTYSAIRSVHDLRLIAWAFLVGAAFAALYSVAAGTYGAGGRLGGLFDPNFFAAQLVAAMALAGFMFAVVRSPLGRLVLLVFVGIYVTAFVLTESRGGLVALGVALAAAVALSGRLRPRAVAVVLIAVAAGMFYYGSLAGPAVRARITNVSAQGSAGRSDEWRIALKIAGRKPLQGVGFGNFQVVEPTYVTSSLNLLKPGYVISGLEVHNTYLELLSELGAVGLSLFLGLVALALTGALQAGKRFESAGDAAAGALCRGLAVAAMGMLTAYFFLSGEYQRQLWLVLGLLAAASALRPPEAIDST